MNKRRRYKVKARRAITRALDDRFSRAGITKRDPLKRTGEVLKHLYQQPIADGLNSFPRVQDFLSTVPAPTGALTLDTLRYAADVVARRSFPQTVPTCGTCGAVGIVRDVEQGHPGVGYCVVCCVPRFIVDVPAIH